MTRAVLLILVALLAVSGSTLSEEAGAFMERLAAQGFPGTGIVLMELKLLEPCTLAIYPPAGSPAGFVIGMGGNNLLDLYLRLEGDGWVLEDSLPDDLPVLKVDSSMIAGSIMYVTVCARDMIRGCMADSAVVIWAFAPVDPGSAGE